MKQSATAGTREEHCAEEAIWDQIGILADGEWTVADLWDHARLLGVLPSQLFPPCYQPLTATTHAA